MKRAVREDALVQLEFLIGKWEVKLSSPQKHTQSIFGETTFDWMEKEQFIVQRTLMNKPQFPRSRGVTPLYNMSLEDNVRKLWRDTSDFSPLEFRQRFTGEVNESKDTIRSAWEKSFHGLDWEYDFELNIKR
ncbi:hypothetical protein CR205_13220 [Alteribacter lacisalsi]|uniref:Uncharacterized protein n=1 Tax=Alteribacter lacisalsi TaxID=2045244 RepID=A0A2W0HGV6_9BACI|nr:hypothetical protein [Alteribacter lacisalsi]PYZ96655.1 hypothetical protein CR205_13220 [Alteribacter lacisalsi]